MAIHRSLLLGLLLCGLTLPIAAADASTDAAPQKKLIVWGGLDWYSPQTVQMNIRRFEELPFDGMVLQGFNANLDGKEIMFDQHCFGRQRFEREHMEQIIETLKSIDFRKFTDNFLRFNVTPGNVDWFDDFDAILHNARLWAEVARETGMKGWMFDAESYQGKLFRYVETKHAGQKSFEEYAEQARMRGRQFMEAVQEGYPDITIMLTHAHSYVARTPKAHEQLPEMEYGLLPAFLNGMIEAAGPQIRIIDGQEQAYGYLTGEDYYRGYHSIRQQALDCVPPELWNKYRATMEAGVAVWANLQLATYHKPGMWPAYYMASEDRLRLFEQNIYHALSAADQYVWLYSEGMSWWEAGAPNLTPAGAIDAMRSARAKVRAGEPLGFDIANRLAAGKAELAETLAAPWPARRAVLSRLSQDRLAPKIDGALDDAAWNDIPVLDAFVPFKASNAEQANVATTAQAAFDDANLYIAFRCAEPQPNGLKNYGEAKDDDVWMGDCVEVFLIPQDGRPLFHFIVDSRNLQWDGMMNPEDWDATWQSETHVGAEEWTAELAIPWSALGFEPSPGRTLGVNLCRHRSVMDEHTTWSPMFASNLEPDRLGTWELAK